MRPVLVAVLLMALSLAAHGGWARQTNPDLPRLFRELRSADDRSIAMLIERRIWDIWHDAEREDVARLMHRGRAAMARGRLDRALAAFDEVVSLDPSFAEGWNKRATVYFLRQAFPESLADIDRTLELERRHFGALEGQGLIYLEMGEEARALEAFEAVLEIHPHAAGVRTRVEELRRKLGQRAI